MGQYEIIWNKCGTYATCMISYYVYTILYVFSHFGCPGAEHDPKWRRRGPRDPGTRGRRLHFGPCSALGQPKCETNIKSTSKSMKAYSLSTFHIICICISCDFHICVSQLFHMYCIVCHSSEHDASPYHSAITMRCRLFIRPLR